MTTTEDTVDQELGSRTAKNGENTHPSTDSPSSDVDPTAPSQSNAYNPLDAAATYASFTTLNNNLGSRITSFQATTTLNETLYTGQNSTSPLKEQNADLRITADDDQQTSPIGSNTRIQTDCQSESGVDTRSQSQLSDPTQEQVIPSPSAPNPASAHEEHEEEQKVDLSPTDSPRREPETSSETESTREDSVQSVVSRQPILNKPVLSSRSPDSNKQVDVRTRLKEKLISKAAAVGITRNKPVETKCFHLKGSMLTLTVLELHEYRYDHFNAQMAQVVKQAPSFFQQTPVVVSLEKLKDPNEVIDFLDLTQLCQEYGLYPIAIKGGNEDHQLAAIVAGLPKIPASKPKPKASQRQEAHATGGDQASHSTASATHSGAGSGKPQSQRTASGSHESQHEIGPNNIPTLSNSQTKVVNRPVRSGQQVYAPGGDLIVLGPVSAGAEVLADGNIHIYGPLRGRALAGVKGNPNARVFCQSLEAELISVAGNYKVSEDLRNLPTWKCAVQASLQEKHLNIVKI